VQSVTEKLKDKLDPEDKEKVEAAVKDGLEWLDENQVCEAPLFSSKLGSRCMLLVSNC
jgi:heat shock protein 5